MCDIDLLKGESKRLSRKEMVNCMVIDYCLDGLDYDFILKLTFESGFKDNVESICCKWKNKSKKSDTIVLFKEYSDEEILAELTRPSFCYTELEIIIPLELKNHISKFMVSISTMEIVDTKLNDFRNHLQIRNNQHIFFSAPFGVGKSTFLDYFMSNNAKYYDVFHLYPVNYAVASNADIMEYIKVHILGELMLRDITLSEHDYNDWIYAHQWILSELKSPKTIVNGLKGILKLIPTVDPKGTMTLKVLEQFEKLHNSFQSFKKKHIDSSETSHANRFLAEISEQKGSLYDTSFITQLIIKLVEAQRRDHKREQVLVIDDLDRMDPEHIFRILNVLASHFDQGDRGLWNKFGFDRLILVGDYDNIQHIYHHKYGEHTDFSGYFNKFFSSGVFQYELSMEELERRNSLADIFKCEILEFIIPDMIRSGAITMREYRRLRKLQNHPCLRVRNITRLKCEMAYMLFMQIMDHDTFVNKLKICASYLNECPRYSSIDDRINLFVKFRISYLLIYRVPYDISSNFVVFNNYSVSPIEGFLGVTFEPKVLYERGDNRLFMMDPNCYEKHVSSIENKIISKEELSSRYKKDSLSSNDKNDIKKDVEGKLISEIYPLLIEVFGKIKDRKGYSMR